MNCSVLFLTMRDPEVTNEMFCTVPHYEGP